MRLTACAISVCTLLAGACGREREPDAAAIQLSFKDLPDYVNDLADVPDSVRKISGRRVEMLGFLLANGCEGFLFSRFEVHGCVPSTSGMEGTVRVALAPGRGLLAYGQRAKVKGLFTVGPTMQDGYCLDMYQMQVEAVELLK